jgi:DNA repair protein RadC
MKYSKVVLAALNEIREMQKKDGTSISCSNTSITQMKLLVSDIHQEHFGILFLDTQNRLIEDEVMFHGTIDSASVYPRIIVKRALDLGANAIIVGHNHPSGNPEPSTADISITKKIKNACKLFEIRLLDHIIVGCDESTSLSSRGLM